MTDSPDPPDSLPLPSSLTLNESVKEQQGNIDLLSSKTIPIANMKPLPVMQEETRGKLARSLLITYQVIIGIVILQIVYGYVALFSTDANLRDQKMTETQNQYVKELITLVLTSATGILGTAIGFYFGKQDSK